MKKILLLLLLPISTFAQEKDIILNRMGRYTGTNELRLLDCPKRLGAWHIVIRDTAGCDTCDYETLSVNDVRIGAGVIRISFGGIGSLKKGEKRYIIYMHSAVIDSIKDNNNIIYYAPVN